MNLILSDKIGILKWFTITFFATVFTMVFFIGSVSAAEQITNFDVNYKINKDRTVNVTETIYYDFGNFSRHGIYRTIINNSVKGLLGTSIDIDNVSVTDEYGRPYPFVKNKIYNKIEIKVGDPRKVVTGLKIYVINYRLKRPLSFLPSQDEFYWNVTGNDWYVPIINTSARVELFEPLENNFLTGICYAGRVNSRSKCSSADIETDSHGKVVAYKFRQNFIRPGEGFSVAVGWPKGLINPPNIFQKIYYNFVDNKYLLMPFVTFGILFAIWWVFGRDKKKSKIIIPEYDVPNGLTPIEVGTLIDDKTDIRDISAEIIFLATRGYIKINKEKSESIFTNTYYTLDKLKNSDESLSVFEQELMDALFPGVETIYKISYYSSDYSKAFAFQNSIKQSLKKISKTFVEKGFYTHNVKILQTVYLVLSFVVVFIAIYFAGNFGLINMLAIILSGIMFALFAKIMPRKTELGNEMLSKIKGLKLYLNVAEKDRINFHNAPEKNPEVFEKLLPYAMVLNVEKKWAEQFKDIYVQNPSWYSAPGFMESFNSLTFVSSLKTFNASSAGLFAASAGSAFGGGGGVGGGGGGGGGGSW